MALTWLNHFVNGLVPAEMQFVITLGMTLKDLNDKNNNMDAMLYEHFANGSNPAQPLHEWLHAARKYSIPRC